MKTSVNGTQATMAMRDCVRQPQKGIVSLCSTTANNNEKNLKADHIQTWKYQVQKELKEN